MIHQRPGFDTVDDQILSYAGDQSTGGRFEMKHRSILFAALGLGMLLAGMRIDVQCVATVPFGVDTPADLARAQALLKARS